MIVALILWFPLTALLALSLVTGVALKPRTGFDPHKWEYEGGSYWWVRRRESPRFYWIGIGQLSLFWAVCTAGFVVAILTGGL